MAALPAHVRDEVRAELARRFDTLRWEEIDSSTASEWYRRFVKDPKIGGVLAPHMPEGNIRVWIKDGPAKEYRRALEGQGYMAEYTTRAYPGPEAVVRSALGQGWRPRPGTVVEKPMRCLAENHDCATMSVAWGPFSALQALVWHALLVRAQDPDRPITLVLTKPSSAPLDADDWALAQKVVKIVGADCKQITYAAVRKSDSSITEGP